MNTTNQTLIEDFTLVPLPAWWESPWFWALGLAMAGVAYWLWRRWSRRPLPEPAPVSYAGPYPPTAVDEALRQLRELRARVPQMQDYDLAIEASEILRRFIEGKHQVPIRYLTSREFLENAAENSGIIGTRRTQLAQFLSFCDLGKFARQPATVPEMLNTVDTAIQFVVESGKTTPLEATAAVSTGGAS